MGTIAKQTGSCPSAARLASADTPNLVCAPPPRSAPTVLQASRGFHACGLSLAKSGDMIPVSVWEAIKIGTLQHLTHARSLLVMLQVSSTLPKRG